MKILQSFHLGARGLKSEQVNDLIILGLIITAGGELHPALRINRPVDHLITVDRIMVP